MNAKTNTAKGLARAANAYRYGYTDTARGYLQGTLDAMNRAGVAAEIQTQVREVQAHLADGPAAEACERIADTVHRVYAHHAA